MMKKYLERRREKKRLIKERRQEIGIFREYFELFSEVLIYVFFVMTFLLQSFVIPTGSMEDTLLIGDHLLVDKVAYSRSNGKLDSLFFPQVEIKRGMIVTFKSPPEIEKEYVKRVIGLPGETIKIVDKRVYIDGKLLVEPYTYFKDNEISDSYRDNFPGYKIPLHQYFCMGDNRDNSFDSRFWGPVPRDLIIGKPWRIYWSYESSSQEYLGTGITHKIKDIFKTIINFFSKTRWKRTIKKIE
jgi:signal peptidase I